MTKKKKKREGRREVPTTLKWKRWPPHDGEEQTGHLFVVVVVDLCSIDGSWRLMMMTVFFVAGRQKQLAYVSHSCLCFRLLQLLHENPEPLIRRFVVGDGAASIDDAAQILRRKFASLRFG